MKFKFYIIVSILYTSTVYGDELCPDLRQWTGKESGFPSGWSLLWAKSNQPQELVFQSAWLFNRTSGQPAECHYGSKNNPNETVVRLKNPRITSALGQPSFSLKGNVEPISNGVYCRGNINNCRYIFVTFEATPKEAQTPKRPPFEQPQHSKPSKSPTVVPVTPSPPPMAPMKPPPPPVMAPIKPAPPPPPVMAPVTPAPPPPPIAPITPPAPPPPVMAPITPAPPPPAMAPIAPATPPPMAPIAPAPPSDTSAPSP